MENHSRPFAFEKLEGFLSQETLAYCRDVFEASKSDSKFNAPHSNVRELDIKSIVRFRELQDLAKKIQTLLEDRSGIIPLEFSKLWMANTESSDSDMTKLPYVAHFDKARFLKGMIYLYDVDEDCGPIHFAEAAAGDIDERRKKLPADYKERRLNWLSKSELVGDMTPITGPAGDMVLFDTNAPHHAGRVREGRERKVLRFDFVHTDFNVTRRPLVKVLQRMFGSA